MNAAEAALARRQAQLHDAEATMRLHTRTETRDGVKCARCLRVGLDHRWPCGPHERAKEIAVARLGVRR